MSINRPVWKYSIWIDKSKINWSKLDDTSILKLDYEKMRKNNEDFEEELIKEVIKSETETF